MVTYEAVEARAKPKPKQRPTGSANRTITHEAAGPDREPRPLALNEAVDLWLLWLGITDIDTEPPPGHLLPQFVEQTIRDIFRVHSAQDRLTLSLGFVRLVQSLMTVVRTGRCKCPP